DRVIAGQLAIDVRKWTHLKRQLIASGKLYLTAEGHLHNARAEAELTKRRPRRNRPATPPQPQPDPAPTSAQPQDDLGSTSPQPPPGQSKNGNKIKGNFSGLLLEERSEKKKAVLSSFDSSVAAREQKDDLRCAFSNGRVELFNGLKAYWLERF